MKTIFGVVSLLIGLAMVGLVSVPAGGRALGVAANESGASAGPQMSGSATVRAQTQPLQDRVADDVAKAIGQGAAARREEADRP